MTSPSTRLNMAFNRSMQNPAQAPLMGSPADAMAQFPYAVQTQYGGAQGYLHKIGVSDSDIKLLQAKPGQQVAAY